MKRRRRSLRATWTFARHTLTATGEESKRNVHLRVGDNLDVCLSALNSPHSGGYTPESRQGGLTGRESDFSREVTHRQSNDRSHAFPSAAGEDLSGELDVNEQNRRRSLSSCVSRSGNDEEGNTVRVRHTVHTKISVLASPASTSLRVAPGVS